jgi:predicted nucleic acid-binding protein
MSDRVFLDTNILIYGYSQDEPDKQQRAIDCVQSGDVWISTQVLNETINVLKRKFLLEYAQIRAVVAEFTEQFEMSLRRSRSEMKQSILSDRLFCWLGVISQVISDGTRKIFQLQINGMKNIWKYLRRKIDDKIYNPI